MFKLKYTKVTMLRLKQTDESEQQTPIKRTADDQIEAGKKQHRKISSKYET